MIYNILQDIEKHIPHNMTEAKSKVALPAYRVITSANFAVIVLAFVVLLAILFLPSVFAYSEDIVDRNGIKDIVVHDLNQNTSAVTFSYCLNKYSRDSIGALVTSDLDSIPVPIDSDGVKYRQCITYGTKILAESDSVKVTLFQNNDIDSLVSSFNAMVYELKNDLIQIQQKITQYEKQGKPVEEIVKNLDLVEKQLKSAQSSLKTLIMVKNN
jgi:hypothetical protein